GPPTAPVVDLAGGVEHAAAESFAWNLLRRGDATGARRVLQRSTGPVGPFVEATVALAADGAIEPLTDAYLASPAGPSNLVSAAVAADSGQVLTLARRLVDAGPDGIAAAGSLQTHLHYGERYDHAAAVGEIVYSGAAARAQTAFDVACSWSRAGDADRALEWVRRAIADGFAAPRLLDGEPDLAPVRAHAGWTVVRAGLS
ncbi:MAG: hypothetical protein ACSLFO_10155, partial [Acidimicrobiales bacterium]